MSDLGDWIWVVCPNGGSEGLSAPVAAFTAEAPAKAYVEHVSEIGYRRLEVCKVPICTFHLPMAHVKQ